MVITGDMLEERINKTMVGRSFETEMFKKQFNRVLEGGMGLTIVSGRPGIGKSFFVEHAAGIFKGGSATYVHGKFRQYDKGILTAFSEVIEQTVKHILTLPAESLKNIKNDLNQKLGADARLILSVCPYAQILLETHKAIDANNLKQLKYRVRKAVYQFFATVSMALFPLIIFIDNLQWADTLSVNIIETICQDYEFLNLHLVLAWRDDESGKAYLNPAKLPEGDDIRIELSELTYEDIDQYIRLVLEQDIERKDYLIRMLYGLTLGNPFNTSRFLRLFLQENVLAYSEKSKKWLVRHDKLGKLNLPADIEQLLTRQIDGLAREDKELLPLSGILVGIIYIEKTGEGGFHDHLPTFVKGFLPSLLAKQPTIVEMNIQNISNPPNENSLLTKRELEVLKLVAQGLSNSEIGGELNVTQRTVKNYLSIIYSKLEVDNRVKAVMKAKELNIIQI